MKLLVLGGNGRTGRLIVERLIHRGHAVTVGGRSDPQLDGVSFERVDLLDAKQVRRAADLSDCVISALASGKSNPVCSSVARALSHSEGLRYITIGGAGVDAPGDAKAFPDKIIGLIMRIVVREMLADRQAELAILRQSSLSWTMLRPPRLTDAPGGAAVAVTHDRPAASAIARADLARAAVEAIGDETLFRRAPFVAGVKSRN